MKTIGIIAEYNPFHKGHEFQIGYAKKSLKADSIIIAMSGNFTQRGGPAICDKITRAKTAIIGGADLVVELPIQIATASIMAFAQGAVKLLNSLGCNTLLFGSECGDIDYLSRVSDVFLLDEHTYCYSQLTKAGIKTSEARIKAINLTLNDSLDYTYVNHPNNLLGICYLCAIKRGGYNIKPITHKRMGQNYQDCSLPSKHIFASATAIREVLFNKQINEIAPYVPEYAYSTLLSEFNDNKLVFPDDFFREIKNKFQHSTEQSNKKYFRDTCYQSISASFMKYNSYADAISSLLVNYPRVRIERDLFRFLLDCPETSVEEVLQLEDPPISVLATSDKSYTILANIENNECKLDENDMLYYRIQGMQE